MMTNSIYDKVMGIICKGGYLSPDGNEAQRITAEIISEMTLQNMLQNVYLDYVNNYLTVDKFAEHYGISSHDATMLIMVCGSVHEAIVAEYKERNL